MSHLLFQLHQAKNYFHVHMPPRDMEARLGTEDYSACTEINFVQSLLLLKDQKTMKISKCDMKYCKMHIDT